MKKIIQVAIAILTQQGKILLAWRDEHLHQGGQYEFAGGKIEQGETAEQACRREVAEETGLQLSQMDFYDEIIHDYGDKIVHLQFFIAEIPPSDNHDIYPQWCWVYRDELCKFPFPQANRAIIQRLTWQPLIKISANLSDSLHLDDNMALYWRCLEQLSIEQAVMQLSDFIVNYPHLAEKLIVNWDIYQQCSYDIQHYISTIHLREKQLFDDVKCLKNKRYIASCHSLTSVQQAENIGCDAVFCSPIQYTPTHPEIMPLGWNIVQEWGQGRALLIYALGGLQKGDLAQARLNGAFGIAGIRGF